MIVAVFHFLIGSPISAGPAQPYPSSLPYNLSLFLPLFPFLPSSLRLSLPLSPSLAAAGPGGADGGRAATIEFLEGQLDDEGSAKRALPPKRRARRSAGAAGAATEPAPPPAPPQQ